MEILKNSQRDGDAWITSGEITDINEVHVRTYDGGYTMRYKLSIKDSNGKNSFFLYYKDEHVYHLINKRITMLVKHYENDKIGDVLHIFSSS
ncbi:hypothetical protein ACULN0_01970 [Pectobacterium actinidiae]|uniref:hypothetical protein n=1 Tax=Pectobacterium actinidiae TaxID=1507808 RepID=UPI004040A4BD